MSLDRNVSQVKLEADVREAIKLWHKDYANQSPIDYLYIFQKRLFEGLLPGQANNQILFNALEILERRNVNQSQLLRKRFLDGNSVISVANLFNVAESTLFSLQNQAIDALAEVVHDMEKSAIMERQSIVEKRMGPPSYVHLVGLDKHFKHLINLLASPEPPWVIVMEGLGGIGKTTLAQAIVRQINHKNIFYDFGWVSARVNRFDLGGSIKGIEKPILSQGALIERLVQQLTNLSLASMSPQQIYRTLEARLKRGPHLIVIDNLETVVDVEALLPTFRNIVGPSKILLTSRKGILIEPDVYRFVVPELSRAHSYELIRKEARRRNHILLAEGSDEPLERIYQTVGGNPLALRLIVGQTQIHNLDLILNDLKAARGQKADNLYTYIFHQAWRNLDETSRIALLTMPLVIAKGGSFDYLKAVTGLNGPELTYALENLVNLNLIDAKGGGLNTRRYAIHNLTRTFLQEQVVKWE